MTRASRGVCRPSGDLLARSLAWLGLPHPTPSTLGPWAHFAVCWALGGLRLLSTSLPCFVQTPPMGFQKPSYARCARVRGATCEHDVPCSRRIVGACVVCPGPFTQRSRPSLHTWEADPEHHTRSRIERNDQGAPHIAHQGAMLRRWTCHTLEHIDALSRSRCCSKPPADVSTPVESPLPCDLNTSPPERRR